MQAIVKQECVNIESVKQALSQRIDSAGFTAWIAPLQFEVNENCLNLVAHNQFAADYVKRVYENTLKDVAADFLLDVNICVRKNSEVVMPVASANDNVVCKYEPEQSVKTNCETTFDKFIACDENMFALAACKKIAMGNASFSQLFIYGPAGCGKSMLANCICSESDKNVLMMTGGQFVADFARSLRDHTIFSFKDYCRDCDTFIMDDICALSGKRATTEEFIQLVLDLREAGKNIVLTSSVAPSALTGFDRRMQSVFGSGLVVDITAPNAFARRNMLIRSGIDREVAEELSKRLAGDGHLVNGVISKIKTYEELMGEHVNMEIASRLLGDMLSKNKTPLSMVKSMCEKLGVSYDEICGNSRARRLTRARQMMMFVLKNTTNLSLTEIGNVCGGRDHATVVYALSQIEAQKNSDLMLVAEIADLEKICK